MKAGHLGLALILACWAVPQAGAQVLFPPPEPVHVVEITAPDAEGLAALVDRGFDVSNVRGLTATVYADGMEYAELAGYGWPVRYLETQPGAEKLVNNYRSNPEIEALFTQYAAAYPNLCRVSQVGTSVQGRPLWVIKLTSNPDIAADKPAVRYIATIHGDEPIGTEMCLKFTAKLLTQYGSNARVTSLLDNTVVWIMPLMNPDGMELKTRRNYQSKDLNREFPVYGIDFTGTIMDGEPLGDTGRPPEVAAVMRWCASETFVLSANFHAGAVVANYPYDNEPGIVTGEPAYSPDEELFQWISLRYAMNNSAMRNSTEFSQGITNGSAWYSLAGGMMDWNYRYLGCMEVTMELSEIKWPYYLALNGLWIENEEAMLAYLEGVHYGVRGLALNRVTGEPVRARVLAEGNSQPVFSSPVVGNYHRILLPGTYNLSWSAPDYVTYHVDGVEVTGGAAVREDVYLSDGDLNGDRAADGADVRLAVDALLGRNGTVDADVDGRGLAATDLQALVNLTG